MIDRYRHCLSANSFSVFRHKKLDGDCVLYSDYAKLEAEAKLLWEYFDKASQFRKRLFDANEVMELRKMENILTASREGKENTNEI